MASRATKSGLAAESQRKVSDFVQLGCVFIVYSVDRDRDIYGRICTYLVS